MSSLANNKITNGVIWKQLLLFFFPIAIGTFFQQLYNMIDAIVVGQFIGKEALASVGGSSSQIINFIVGFFTGFTSGASIIIAQAYGAKDRRRVQRGLHTAYTLAALAGVAISIIGVLLCETFLRLMNTPQEIIGSSALYLRIYFSGIIFVFIYNMGSGILRASGDSKSPLYYLICCCIINIVLDLAFVLIFKMGVAGVALATLIAQAVSAVLITLKLMRLKGIMRLYPKKAGIDSYILRSQLRIGLPTGFESVLFGITNISIQTALNSFGTDTMAAWSAYGKLDSFFWLISSAFGISISTFVGQNYGAGKIDRVYKSTRVCLIMDLAATAFLVGIIMIFKEGLLRIFTSDAEVIEIGVRMISLIAPWYAVFSFIEILSGSLRGTGNVLVPVLITLFGVCVLRIIWLATVLKIYPGLSVLIASYPVTWVITAAAFIVYYFVHKKRSLERLSK